MAMEIEINKDNNRGWITVNKNIRVKFGLDIYWDLIRASG